ncbi:hypothetical protein BB559_000357 [Furculomyces boomerangus]|uniref:Ataxin-10 homolog n=1 Tax=Furculomyces boomerangus TaxID=61424 RepID=A0A2T9Z5I8_9FUNG|nr:hypothetical protein BB559_000357 [Furculomyces boomerangus]
MNRIQEILEFDEFTKFQNESLILELEQCLNKINKELARNDAISEITRETIDSKVYELLAQFLVGAIDLLPKISLLSSIFKFIRNSVANSLNFQLNAWDNGIPQLLIDIVYNGMILERYGESRDLGDMKFGMQAVSNVMSRKWDRTDFFVTNRIKIFAMTKNPLLAYPTLMAMYNYIKLNGFSINKFGTSFECEYVDVLLCTHSELSSDPAINEIVDILLLEFVRGNPDIYEEYSKERHVHVILLVDILLYHFGEELQNGGGDEVNILELYKIINQLYTDLQEKYVASGDVDSEYLRVIVGYWLVVSTIQTEIVKEWAVENGVCKKSLDLLGILDARLPKQSKPESKKHDFGDLTKLFIYKVELVQIVGNLAHGSKDIQDETRIHFVKNSLQTNEEPGVSGLTLMLSLTQIDTNSKFIREHAILAIKMLLENNGENQRIIEKMEPISKKKIVEY